MNTLDRSRGETYHKAMLANAADQQYLCFKLHSHLVDLRAKFDMMKNGLHRTKQKMKELEAEMGQKQKDIENVERNLSMSNPFQGKKSGMTGHEWKEGYEIVREFTGQSEKASNHSSLCPKQISSSRIDQL
jgi:uncharacterized coiled-coil DUF342 family protein